MGDYGSLAPRFSFGQLSCQALADSRPAFSDIRTARCAVALAWDLLGAWLLGPPSGSRNITGVKGFAIGGPLHPVFVFSQLQAGKNGNRLVSGSPKPGKLRKTIEVLLSALTVRAVMGAPAGQQNSPDGSLATAAGFAGALVDAVLKLEKAALAIGADVIRHRRAAQADGVP